MVITEITAEAGSIGGGVTVRSSVVVYGGMMLMLVIVETVPGAVVKKISVVVCPVCN